MSENFLLVHPKLRKEYEAAIGSATPGEVREALELKRRMEAMQLEDAFCLELQNSEKYPGSSFWKVCHSFIDEGGLCSRTFYADTALEAIRLVQETE